MTDKIALAFEAGCITGIFFVFSATAVAAVLKSKGKVPEWVGIPDKRGKGHWICPNCGTDVSFYESRNNYCSDCGQKIDWSE